MTRMQKKTKKTDLIPTDKILKYNKEELRPIANRQIASLKRREALTGKSPIYIYEINRVILQEKGEI